MKPRDLLIAIVAGVPSAIGMFAIRAHQLFVRPELTESQAFWHYLPWYVPCLIGLIVAGWFLRRRP